MKLPAKSPKLETACRAGHEACTTREGLRAALQAAISELEAGRDAERNALRAAQDAGGDAAAVAHLDRVKREVQGLVEIRIAGLERKLSEGETEVQRTHTELQQHLPAWVAAVQAAWRREEYEPAMKSFRATVLRGLALGLNLEELVRFADLAVLTPKLPKDLEAAAEPDLLGKRLDKHARAIERAEKLANRATTPMSLKDRYRSYRTQRQFQHDGGEGAVTNFAASQVVPPGLIDSATLSLLLRSGHIAPVEAAP